MKNLSNRNLKNAYLGRNALTLVLVTSEDSFAILNKGSHIDFLDNVLNRREEEGVTVNPVYAAIAGNPPYEGGYLAGRFSSRNAARRRYFYCLKILSSLYTSIQVRGPKWQHIHIQHMNV